MAKHPDDHSTMELKGLGVGGRRAGPSPRSPAERQRAYRDRRRLELYETEPANMSRVTIVRQLAQALHAIEDKAEFSEGAAWQAQKLVAEVVTRYGLDWRQITRWRQLSSRVTKRRL